MIDKQKIIHKEKSKSRFIEKTLKDFPNIRKYWLEKSYEKWKGNLNWTKQVRPIKQQEKLWLKKTTKNINTRKALTWKIGYAKYKFEKWQKLTKRGKKFTL